LPDRFRRILEDIGSKLKNSVIEGDSVYIPDLDLRIQVYPPETEDGVFLSLRVAVSHPSFYDEPLEAYFPAQASSFEEAAEQTVNMLFAGLLSAVFDYLQGSAAYTLKSALLGEEKSWSVSEGDLLLFNRKDGETLWEPIKDTLALRLGNRPFYYVNALAGELPDGEASANCEINGEPSPEISSLLAKNVKKTGSAGYLRQFFLLNQNAPYKPYPHNRQDVDRFTEKAVSLFNHCQTKETYQDLLKNICEVTADIDLACELKNFLPEICAELFYNEQGVNFAETIILIKDGEEITAYKDQFTSYRWIKERLCRGFEADEFSNDLFRRLISMSATHSVIAKAKKENGEIRNFTVQTTLNVPPTYELR
jgi:hypothetical protein